MLPTFVIALREGLEAALIVGIIAAFLRQQRRRDLVRSVFVGVGLAAVLCLAIGIGLDVFSSHLPQRQQEGVETVIGALAVGLVTYMVVWMRQHARDLRGDLEGFAAQALTSASAGRAMVAMAFLAVLREGVETAVFLLAAFNESGSGASAAVGAVVGLVVAIALGYGIYRGGVHLNLTKFFRVTGIVLVLVAAGIVVNVLHTAHEAGWVNFGQQATVDLSWLVVPGTVLSSLLTGMLGLQPHPVAIEVVGWLLYLIPVGAYVLWPAGKGLPRRTTARLVGYGAGASAILTITLLVTLPGAPATHDETDLTGLTRTGSELKDGFAADVYAGPATPSASTQQSIAALSPTLRLAEVAELNGGRLPLGLNTSAGITSVAATYTATTVRTAWVDPATRRILDERTDTRVAVAVSSPDPSSSVGQIALSKPALTGSQTLDDATVAANVKAAEHDADTASRRSEQLAFAWLAGITAVVLGGLTLALRRTPGHVPVTETKVPAMTRRH